MSAGWVAGAVRGRELAQHRLGSTGVENLAACRGIDDALAMLAGTTYQRAVRAGPNLEVVQHAVGAQALWHLRILAGWVPPPGVRMIQALAGWFEIANLENLAVAVAGAETGLPVRPYDLGRLSVAWRGVRLAGTLAEVRETLAATRWGDPGGDTVETLLVGVRLSWAGLLRRVITGQSEWGMGLGALVLAEDRFLPGGNGRRAPPRHDRALGDRWRDTTDLNGFVTALPAAAGWVFAAVRRSEELWQAEETWWKRLADDGADLLRRQQLGRDTVIGSAAVIIADARFTQVSLNRAVRPRAERRGNALV